MLLLKLADALHRLKYEYQYPPHISPSSCYIVAVILMIIKIIYRVLTGMLGLTFQQMSSML